MRDAILAASVATAVEHGLNDWTVEEVANKARCAKGLVNYHYRSKAELLDQTAEAIAYHRQARKLAAVGQDRGGLDGLWGAVVDDVRSGWFAAWLEFAARGRGEPTGPHSAAFGSQLVEALTKSLELPVDALPGPTVLEAMLDGIAIRLLAGEAEDRVKDAYHRLWLGVLTP